MKKEVYLINGIGNRLNNILNYADELDKVTFIWVVDEHCNARWEDLFSSPSINITYIQRELINTTSFTENRYPNENVFFLYEGNNVKVKAAQQFISSLVPSKQVSKLMPNIPKDTCGYYIRVFHPISKVKKIIKIPKGSFLATDSEEQRSNSPGTIQTPGEGGTYDLCNNIRSRQGVIMAIADWFSLFKCSKIIEIGLPFKSLSGVSHSTFIDAQRILGCNIFTLSRTLTTGKMSNQTFNGESHKNYTKQQ